MLSYGREGVCCQGQKVKMEGTAVHVMICIEKGWAYYFIFSYTAWMLLPPSITFATAQYLEIDLQNHGDKMDEFQQYHFFSLRIKDGNLNSLPEASYSLPNCSLRQKDSAGDIFQIKRQPWGGERGEGRKGSDAPARFPQTPWGRQQEVGSPLLFYSL